MILLLLYIVCLNLVLCIYLLWRIRKTQKDVFYLSKFLLTMNENSIEDQNYD
jgi:flagellar basal body-associated protein FliL